MRLIVLFFMVFSFSYLKAQDINYNHKIIAKEIERIWDIEENREEMSLLNADSEFDGKFFRLKDVGYIYVGRVKSCRAGGCSINHVSNGASEYFDYFICYNNEGVVEGIKVFNYAATHGQEIAARGWLKQFVGFSSEEKLEVGKNVDSISGATISVYAITEDVKVKTQFLSKKMEKM